MTAARPVRAVVLDIEGTTTPISFVHEVLFPFAAARLDETCARAADDPAVAAALAQLHDEYEQEPARDDAAVPAFGDGAAYAGWLMRQDRKSTGLKALQGLIWRAGYEEGVLHGVVYDDVPVALRRWRRQGVRLFVFSSGSVLAQRLVFAHTQHGDLTPCFEGYFDTTTGPKRAPGAYARIAEACGLPPEQILFASDAPAELDAAAAAGWQTAWVQRPGEPRAGTTTHRRCERLTELA